MSGLGELGGLPGFVMSGAQVSQKDIDEYDQNSLQNPSVDSAWFGAGTVAGTAVTAIALKNQQGDYPRNALYSFTGGTTGGTITGNFIDQFGNAVSETVSQGSGAAGSVYGTAIVGKFLSGTVSPNTSTTGTYTIGYGTLSNGSAQSNWFGLMTRIGGTSDVRNIRWVNNGTPTGLNKGTSYGTLIDLTRSAFQGTSGVAITDAYTTTVKSSYDNTSKGIMSAL